MRNGNRPTHLSRVWAKWKYNNKNAVAHARNEWTQASRQSYDRFDMTTKKKIVEKQSVLHDLIRHKKIYKKIIIYCPCLCALFMLWLFIIIRRCVRVTLNCSNISRFFLSFCAFRFCSQFSVHDICRRRRRKSIHSIVRSFNNFRAVFKYWNSFMFTSIPVFFSVLEPDLLRTSN